MSRQPSRVVRVAQLMGTVVSVHAIIADPERGIEARVDTDARAVFDQLAEIERVFSTYRADSDICRLRDGTLLLADADSRISEVRLACASAAAATGGLFSAEWRGWFDPTGYVKGWAVEQAFEDHLAGLLEEPGMLAIGINAGGDMQLATAVSADWVWNIGVANPLRAGELMATIELRDGAVATSGTAERGMHLYNPNTGESVSGTLSATVIAPRLRDADTWATAAAIAGADDLSWIADAPHTSGLIVGPDGGSRRWTAGVEIGDALLDPWQPKQKDASLR